MKGGDKMPIIDKIIFFCCDVVGYVSTLIMTQNYLALAAIIAACILTGTVLGKLLPKKKTSR